MPNGGSDCCGTCWFNRANGGEAGSANHDHSIPSHCEIRDLAIEDPFYTYCANHPYRLHRKAPVPFGPVYVHVESFEKSDGVTEFRSERKPWKDAPDTEEIRSQLLGLLEDPGNLSDHYPFYGDDLLRVVVDELERLREGRAIPILERIANTLRTEGEAWDGVQDAIGRIRRAVQGSRGER
ncbi:MAG: hypothetical protein OXU69_02520 [Gemmatimonadota bacterium]|nr:hypothetical protein [Gemmatimonadota bacterium]MDE2983555.1 hypothetical protein [Gemmatimonadota bacterium]